jgi:two-component system NtrC family sensor kinase
VLVSVTDDGPGVPPGIAERIFEPFFTTKPEGQGTGLGLSICYRIAEEHGGSVRLENVREGGARFVVDLPAGTDP